MINPKRSLLALAINTALLSHHDAMLRWLAQGAVLAWNELGELDA